MAERVTTDIVGHLALALYLLSITFDPELLVIGGGIASVGDPLLSQIDAAMKRLAIQSNFVESLDLAHRVHLNASQDLGAIGAAAVARRSLLNGDQP